MLQAIANGDRKQPQGKRGMAKEIADMRMKGIKDLCQLSGDEFVREVAIGIGHVYRHAAQLFSEAQTFADSAARSYRIVLGVASEECAKILILLDALRMAEHGLRGRQLNYFNDHLAKGIYVEYCWTRPVSLDDVRKFVERNRLAYYRDGPNDCDWEFRNEILRRRDQHMYVDYVDTEEGRYWWTPDGVSPIEPSLFLQPPEPAIWGLVMALEKGGVLQEAALGEVQRYWQEVQMSDAMHWQELRKRNGDLVAILRTRGLLRDERYADVVVDNWLFPLHMFDLTLAAKQNRCKG